MYHSEGTYSVKNILSTRFGSIRQLSRNFGGVLVRNCYCLSGTTIKMVQFLSECVKGIRRILHNAEGIIIIPDNMHHHNTGLKFGLAECNT